MIDDAIREQIERNWRRVSHAVAEVVEQHGRKPDAVRIVGVSKYVDAETTRALFDAGCLNLGESRPQVLWEKAKLLGKDVQPQWHMIGHLQRNKIRRTLQCRPTIHSVDSERLLQALSDEAAAQQLEIEVLLEVNVSGEESKTGMTAEHLIKILERPPRPGIRVIGLMAMAGRSGDLHQARSQFEQVRQLSDNLRTRTGYDLSELSMGMSSDFREAIAAGATMVRIGSSLFEGMDVN